MVDFKITPLNGKNHEKYYVVHAFNWSSGDWIFIQSFFSRQAALDFIYYVKRCIKRGDFSSLNLKN